MGASPSGEKAHLETRNRSPVGGAVRTSGTPVDHSLEVISVRARLKTGYYDQPRVKAKIVGALMESLWLQ